MLHLCTIRIRMSTAFLLKYHNFHLTVGCSITSNIARYESNGML